jgi:hypothetical protein
MDYKRALWPPNVAESYPAPSVEIGDFHKPDLGKLLKVPVLGFQRVLRQDIRA